MSFTLKMSNVMGMLKMPQVNMQVKPPIDQTINWSPPVRSPQIMREGGAWFADGSATTCPHISDSSWIFQEDKTPMRDPWDITKAAKPIADMLNHDVCVSMTPGDSAAGLHLQHASCLVQ